MTYFLRLHDFLGKRNLITIYGPCAIRMALLLREEVTGCSRTIQSKLKVTQKTILKIIPKKPRSKQVFSKYNKSVSWVWRARLAIFYYVGIHAPEV